MYPRTDDAYVRANWVGIAPHVSGPITELPIVDNQYVKQGDLLFVVDPRPYQSALDAATAKLQLTELNIKALEDAIRTAKSDQVRLEADAAYDKQYLNRIEPLLAKHFVTANDVFNARSRVSAAEAGVRPRTPMSARRKTSSASMAISTRCAKPRRPPFTTRNSTSVIATSARRTTAGSPILISRKASTPTKAAKSSA